MLLGLITQQLLFQMVVGQGLFDFFGFGGNAAADPFGFSGFGGGAYDPFMAGGGGGGMVDPYAVQSATPDPVAAHDARLTMAEEQMAEVLGESARNSPERRRVEELIHSSGGRFSGDAANLNYLIQEYQMTTPGPLPPPEGGREGGGGRGNRRRGGGRGGRRQGGRGGGGQHNQQGNGQNALNNGGNGQRVNGQYPNQNNNRNGGNGQNNGNMQQANDQYMPIQGTFDVSQQPPGRHSQSAYPPQNIDAGMTNSQQQYPESFVQYGQGSSQPSQFSRNRNNNQEMPPNSPQIYNANNNGNQQHPFNQGNTNNQGVSYNPPPQQRANNNGNVNQDKHPSFIKGQNNNQRASQFLAPPKPDHNNQGFNQGQTPQNRRGPNAAQYNQEYVPQPSNQSPSMQMPNDHAQNTRRQGMKPSNEGTVLPQNQPGQAKTVTKQGPIAADRLRRIETRIQSVNDQIESAKLTNDLSQLDTLQRQLTALNGVKMILSGGRPGTNSVETIQGAPRGPDNNPPPPPPQQPFGPAKNNRNVNNNGNANGRSNNYEPANAGGGQWESTTPWANDMAVQGSNQANQNSANIQNRQHTPQNNRVMNNRPQDHYNPPVQNYNPTQPPQGPDYQPGQGQRMKAGRRQGGRQKRQPVKVQGRRTNSRGSSVQTTPPTTTSWPTEPTTPTLAPNLYDVKWIGNEKYIYIDADNADTFQWVKESTIPRSQLDHLPQYQQQEGQGQQAQGSAPA